jgi:hypothetical protein
VAQISPRLGYYVISFGTVLQFLGIVGRSWSPGGDILLAMGSIDIVLGLILGFISLADTLTHDVARPPRLLPALPLVLLVGLSIGGVAFAYQAGQSNGSLGASTVSAQDPGGSTIAATATPVCPPGTFWHEPTERCVSLTVDGSGNPAFATPLPPGATPVCPAGTVWHPEGNHCLSTACPAGFAFNAALFVCELVAPATPELSAGPAPTPACPAGTVWHPAGNHCLSTACPAGFQFDAALFICAQVAGPTAVPTATPTLPPGVTPSPTPEVPPTPTAGPTPTCPDGYFWHPAMGHCMSETCPPGLVWDADGLYCVLPTETPSTTMTPTPTATPSPTPEATPGPTPACPTGYFWHPAMGHCMSTTCPPGLVWDGDGLYCVLPTPTPTPAQG